MLNLMVKRKRHEEGVREETISHSDKNQKTGPELKSDDSDSMALIATSSLHDSACTVDPKMSQGQTDNASFNISNKNVPDVTGKPRSSRRGKARQPRKHQAVSAQPSAIARSALSIMAVAKLARVRAFLNSRQGEILYRASNGCAIVTEAALSAALIAMSIDWELDLECARVEEIVIARFSQRTGTGAYKVPYVVLDTFSRTVFEEKIHEKLRGWGTEEENLLWIELQSHYHECVEAANAGTFRVIEEGHLIQLLASHTHWSTGHVS